MVVLKTLLHNLRCFVFGLLFSSDEILIIRRAVKNQIDRDKMDDMLVDSRISFMNDYDLAELTAKKLEQYSKKKEVVFIIKNQYKNED